MSTNPLKRQRRPRGSLTQELILDAAEAIARDHGFEALTMRAVAARLEATPMALYNHFETKDQLVAGLLDRVLRRFEPPAATGDWVADLGAFARAHRRMLDAHPWAVAGLSARPAEGPGTAWVTEHALEILERGRFPAGPAAAVYRGVVALNHGWVSWTPALGPAEGDYQLVLGALLRGLRG